LEEQLEALEYFAGALAENSELIECRDQLGCLEDQRMSIPSWNLIFIVDLIKVVFGFCLSQLL
jgi:hypothetical protein